MHLVVGDRVGLNTLLHGDSTYAAYLSADTSVAAVNGGAQLVAVRPGSTTVTGLAGLPDTVRVVVTTNRFAVNEIINDVCPNEDERSLRASTPVSSAVQRIHEYHDCQRLIESGHYTALSGIFAHKNVDTLQRWEDFRGGRLAAVIVSFVTKGRAMPYASLGLAPGVSCLLLRATARDEWEARIINQPEPLIAPDRSRHYGDCADSLTWRDAPSSPAHPLVVRVQHGVDMMRRPIAPPVARWDWDARHGLNYIGVKCDSATWCEIGPPDFVPSAPQYLANTQSQIFKGYYDEQFLADSGGQTVSTVFGRIMPGPHLRDVHLMHHNVPQWYHTSSIAFFERASTPSHTFDKYKKWYFATPPAAGASPMIATTDLHLFPRAGNFLTGYRGQLNLHTLADTEVVFHFHPSNIRVATVRWRWLYRDESTWSYCDPTGCCERQTDER
jgi:hypothetical protein